MPRRPRSTAVRDAWRPWALRVLGSLLLLALFWVSPLWTPVQRLEHDFWSSLTAPPPPHAGVLVVGIDEPSLAALGLTPPLPRRLHAQLVDALSAAGAAGLGVDLLFSAAQTTNDDAALKHALQARMPVVLAAMSKGQAAEVLVEGPLWLATDWTSSGAGSRTSGSGQRTTGADEHVAAFRAAWLG